MLAESDDRWFGIAELVEYSTLSDKTVRRYLRAKEHPIPSYKVGGRVLVKRSEFDAWVKEGAPRPRPATDTPAAAAAAILRSMRGV
jgi:excisionase family DNA binding protein